MQGYLDIILRGFIAVAFMFILTKAMGTKQISQLNFFDYIVGITIGSIAATLCIDPSIDILYSLIAMSIFALSDITIALISRKSIAGRRFFTGTPKLLINKGEIVYDALRKAQINMNDLLRDLRIMNYNNISDVEYVIFETNGMLSVVPKENKRPLVAEDMKINNEQEGLNANIIIDGKIMFDNLNAMNKDKSWLDLQLSNQGYSDITNIILATLSDKGQLSVYNKTKPYHKRTVFQ